MANFDIDFDADEETVTRSFAAPKRRSAAPGVLGRLARSLLGGGGSHEESQKQAKATALDLRAYRQRAADLLKRLEAATDRVRELGVLSVRLEELLDDLNSIGAPDADRKPLADLLTELRAFLAKPSPAADEVARLGQRCHDVLTAFATGTAGTRATFWK